VTGTPSPSPAADQHDPGPRPPGHRPPRRTWPAAIAALLIGGAVATGVIVGRNGQPDEPVAATPTRFNWLHDTCETSTTTGSEVETDSSYRQQWTKAQGEPGPGEVSVSISDAFGADRWAYRREEVGPESWWVLEGRLQGTSLDEHRFGLRSFVGAAVVNDRWVVKDQTAWVTNPSEWIATDDVGWVSCPAGNAISPSIGFVMHQLPEPGRISGSCLSDQCRLYVYAGMTVLAQTGVPVTVDGEAMTTYELVGPWRRQSDAAGRPLRASITLDAQNRLRRGVVWDGTTGAVYTSLRADPAPGDRTPIADPSGTPPARSTPPPSAPTTSVVPLTPAG
jgi:hypothetical protein